LCINLEVMFPFGSLLSQVPLILFAALYMLYLGAYTLNRSKIKEAENQLQPREQFVKASPENNSGTYYYQSNFQDREQAVIPVYKAILPDKPLLWLRHVIKEEKVSFNIFGFSLFSRPPPVIA
jgi:hypothetical protein